MLMSIPIEMKAFMQPSSNEEVIDQPLYHMQSYGTGGATSFTFFQTAQGSATNGLADTNMTNAGSLSVGQRFAVLSLGVYMIPSAPMQFSGGSTASALNDIKGVIEGIGSLTFTVLNKTYLNTAPLASMPAGMGTFIGGASYQRTQASAADANGFIAYGNNGVPMPSARYQLRSPVPIPAQVSFNVTVNFPTAITVTTASRLGIFLWGLLIRAKQ
jgi:hypothetical protein